MTIKELKKTHRWAFVKRQSQPGSQGSTELSAQQAQEPDPYIQDKI